MSTGICNPRMKGDTIMKKLTLLLILSIAVIPAVAGTALAGDEKQSLANLVIHITGFESADGIAKVAIVNSRENYESDGSPFMGFNFKIFNNEVKQTVNLPFGEYAVQVFHDANANEEMDTLMFGIPSERYGFSNNPTGSMGPPAYEKAKFVIDSARHSISIRLR